MSISSLHKKAKAKAKAQQSSASTKEQFPNIVFSEDGTKIDADLTDELPVSYRSSDYKGRLVLPYDDAMLRLSEPTLSGWIDPWSGQAVEMSQPSKLWQKILDAENTEHLMTLIGAAFHFGVTAVTSADAGFKQMLLRDPVGMLDDYGLTPRHGSATDDQKQAFKAIMRTKQDAVPVPPTHRGFSQRIASRSEGTPPAERLRILLLSLFNSHELKRFFDSQYPEVTNHINWDGSRTRVSFNVVQALESRGIDEKLWSGLLRARPRRAGDIADVQALF